MVQETAQANDEVIAGFAAEDSALVCLRVHALSLDHCRSFDVAKKGSTVSSYSCGFNIHRSKE